MKNDAKLVGSKALKVLKEAENNYQVLCVIHGKWKAEARLRTGASRCGIFKWARLIEQFDKSQGFRQQLEKEQLTKKEFITRIVAKGMEAEWASGEFQRRLGLPEEYVIDTDPDCGLVRVQAHAGKRDIGFDEYKHSTLIQQGSADIKNPKQVNVQNMVRDALAGGSNFATDSKMSELKAGRAPNVLLHRHACRECKFVLSTARSMCQWQRRRKGEVSWTRVSAISRLRKKGVWGCHW